MTRKIRCGGKPMTVIVLAGGRGRRMRAEKAALAVGRRTLLEHVLAQIQPYFDEILISVSAGQTARFTPLGADSPSRRLGQGGPGPTPAVRVIEDEVQGLGPLGGLLAGLRAASTDACAVIACDIPDVDIPLLRSAARAAGKAEIAVPVGPSGFYEPLFAVYRRSVVPHIEALLRDGEMSLLPLYDRCRTAVVRFEDAGRVRNLNTPADYESYLGSLAGRPPGETRGREKRRRRARTEPGI